MSRDGMFVGFLVALLIALPFVYGAMLHSSERIETITVLYRVQTSHNDGRLHTDDGNIYQVADSFYYSHPRSADLWVELQPNNEYRVVVVGWRVKVLSMFPRIVDVIEVVE